MKHLILFVSFVIGKCAFIHSQSTAEESGKDKVEIPKVYLLYFPNGTPFDRTVFRLTNKPINDELMREAGRRLSEFQALWDKEGSSYLAILFSEIGLPFPYKEILATLTVSDVPSTSIPLLINVKPFLPAAQNPAPLSAFSEIVFTNSYTFTYEELPIARFYAKSMLPSPASPEITYI